MQGKVRQDKIDMQGRTGHAEVRQGYQGPVSPTLSFMFFLFLSLVQFLSHAGKASVAFSFSTLPLTLRLLHESQELANSSPLSLLPVALNSHSHLSYSLSLLLTWHSYSSLAYHCPLSLTFILTRHSHSLTTHAVGASWCLNI